jgi:hypothetical protein
MERKDTRANPRRKRFLEKSFGPYKTPSTIENTQGNRTLVKRPQNSLSPDRTGNFSDLRLISISGKLAS